MAKNSQQKKKAEPRTQSQPIELSRYFNWPRRVPKDGWWQQLATRVRTEYPKGQQRPWGIPFLMAEGINPAAILLRKGHLGVQIVLQSSANYLCFLHDWAQIPETIRGWHEDPCEGIVVGEYELTYADGSRHVQPVRGRYEVPMAESPGSPWLAVGFNLATTIDPQRPPKDINWGEAQQGLFQGFGLEQPPVMLYVMPNPHPQKKIESLTLRGLQESPLLVAGLTLYRGTAHPLRHLPRRMYRVEAPGGAKKIKRAEVDMGSVARIVESYGPRTKKWLQSPYTGLHGLWMNFAKEPVSDAEDHIEAFGAPDATLSVTLEGEKRPREFSLGDAFETGRSVSGNATLEVLGKRRRWVQVEVIDRSTGKPTPTRVHFTGQHGDYLSPAGHPAQINTNVMEDYYSADVVVSDRNFAYVPGQFPIELPVGDVYVEITKGFGHGTKFRI